MKWDGTSEEILKERFKWERVKAPKVWRPTADEEIVGFYGGRTLRSGEFGQYEVALVHVPQRGSLLVSGTVLIALLDSGQIVVGQPVRIVYRGMVPIGEDKSYKSFELYRTDGGALQPEDLPRYVTQ